MSLRKVNIIDTNFAHAKYSTDFQTSNYIEWDRSLSNIKENDIVFVTDNSLYDIQDNNLKTIALLMEPRAINPQVYNWIANNHNKFYKVLTYDNELLKIGNNIEFYPHCGCWIEPKDQKIYDKTKLVSIIASNKKQTIGHNLRHDAINKFKEKIDVFGRGYNPVEYKLEALKDYTFSITIENSKTDYYFTEKLMDCFVTGTVPIYFGAPSIGDFFNVGGMIIFDSLKELEEILSSLSFEKYKSMLPIIKENFELSKKYLISEDWLFNNSEIFNGL